MLCDEEVSESLHTEINLYEQASQSWFDMDSFTTVQYANLLCLDFIFIFCE
jgi:hypothetical protein